MGLQLSHRDKVSPTQLSSASSGERHLAAVSSRSTDGHLAATSLGPDLGLSELKCALPRAAPAEHRLSHLGLYEMRRPATTRGLKPPLVAVLPNLIGKEGTANPMSSY